MTQLLYLRVTLEYWFRIKSTIILQKCIYKPNGLIERQLGKNTKVISGFRVDKTEKLEVYDVFIFKVV